MQMTRTGQYAIGGAGDNLGPRTGHAHDPRTEEYDGDDVSMDEIIGEIRTFLAIAAVADLAGDRGKALSAIAEIGKYATDCTEDA